ncbi:MAG: hypothetical protein F6K13_08110, partial [Okeania sp. SIO2B9]|nr:hypothetical protein [Okeania sp. SIO2B9]
GGPSQPTPRPSPSGGGEGPPQEGRECAKHLLLDEDENFFYTEPERI